MPPRGGFIPAGTLVQNDTAGDNGTAGVKPYSWFSGRMNPPLGDISSGKLSEHTYILD